MGLKVYTTIINGKPLVVTASNIENAKEELKERFGVKRIKLELWGSAFLHSASYNYVSINENPNLEYYNFN